MVFKKRRKCLNKSVQINICDLSKESTKTSFSFFFNKQNLSLVRRKWNSEFLPYMFGPHTFSGKRNTNPFGKSRIKII